MIDGRLGYTRLHRALACGIRQALVNRCIRSCAFCRLTPCIGRNLEPRRHLQNRGSNGIPSALLSLSFVKTQMIVVLHVAKKSYTRNGMYVLHHKHTPTVMLKGMHVSSPVLVHTVQQCMLCSICIPPRRDKKAQSSHSLMVPRAHRCVCAVFLDLKLVDCYVLNKVHLHLGFRCSCNSHAKFLSMVSLSSRWR